MTFRIKDHPGILLKKAARLFEQVANIKLDSLGVTHAQTIVLVRLWEKDGQNQMELTNSAGLDQSTIVRLLDRMEKNKLIRRERSQEDRRVCHFYLTAKAKKACHKLEEHSHAMTEIGFDSFTKKDVDKLNQLIDKLILNLESFLMNSEESL